MEEESIQVGASNENCYSEFSRNFSNLWILQNEPMAAFPRNDVIDNLKT